MNLVRILFNPLDAGSMETFPVRPNTQIIEFLQERFPDGFGGLIRVFVGHDEIAIEDLDYELGDEQQVTILVLPAGGVDLLAVAIYSLVSFAISTVISLIFAPDQPKGLGGGDENPVYSINAPQNKARLGEPIPSHYGTITYTPDVASAPYSFFSNGSNDQYVDMLYCLGHGVVQVNEVLIGNTPLSVVAGDAAKWWVFTPDEHKKRRNEIEKLILSYERGSGDPYRFFENLYTSPELSDPGYAIGEAISDQVATPTAIQGEVTAGYTDAKTGFWYPGKIEWIDHIWDDANESEPPFAKDDVITLTNTVSNNVTFTIGSVVVLENGRIGIYESYTDKKLVDEVLPAGATYQLNLVDPGMVAGPFRAQKEGMIVSRIYVDFLFPNGLYHVSSSGNIRGKTCKIQVTYQRLDEFGTPVDIPTVYVHEITAKTRDPIRRTYSSKLLQHGIYEVTVEKIFPVRESKRDEVSDFNWVGLRSKVVNEVGVNYQDEVYGDVTMLAVRMRATNGLGEAARSRLQVNCTRIFETEDSWNPAVVIADIFTNQIYGMRRDASELDLTDLEETATRFSVSDVQFNGSFSQRATGYESMQNVAGLVAGKVVQEGSLTTVVLDRLQTVRTALFTSANILQDTLRINYTFDPAGEHDGVQIEWREPTYFKPKYVVWPDSAENPEQYTLFGCTDETYATVYAQYLWNAIALRRKTIQFQTEAEGLLPRFGDRIGVSHPLAEWGQSGVVTAVIDGTTLRVDQPLEWVDGKNHRMLLRNEWGKDSNLFTVEPGPAPNQIVVTNGTTSEVYAPGDGLEPTHYAFGPIDEFVTDWIVERIVPQGGNIVQVEAQKYDDKIFEGIDAPYACDAMSSTAANGGFNHYWELMPTPENPDWPFATTRPNTWGEDDNASCWGSWISAPNQKVEWGSGTGYFTRGTMGGWDWETEARKLVYCGVEDVGFTEVVDVKGNSSVVHFSPPTSIYQGSPPTGSSSNMVFTGFQGGHNVGGTMNRNSAGFYAIYVNGVYSSSFSCPVFVSMGPTTGGGADEYSVFIQVGQNGGDYGEQVNVELPFGTVHGRWLNYSYSESSSFEVIPVEGPQADKCIVRCTVTVTVTGSDGSTGSITATGAIESGGTDGVAEIRPTWSSSAYDWPGMFSGTEEVEITLAHLSAFGGVIDHGFLRQGFLRNFT